MNDAVGPQRNVDHVRHLSGSTSRLIAGSVSITSSMTAGSLRDVMNLRLVRYLPLDELGPHTTPGARRRT